MNLFSAIWDYRISRAQTVGLRSGVVLHTDLFEALAAICRKEIDRLARTGEIGAPVSVIVHSLREVNTVLKKDRHFFIDIRHDGIALYDSHGEPLADPQALPPQRRGASRVGIMTENFPL
ncbi:hypothetical protein [Agrobacterium rosae]|uniref:Uncharacterized protein n=1 Tax=Agrobacterium rosae TaxID=1972867 RepID=A0A1R3U6R5_9HYPH|nr:hypothetical protein [Agrobacterium rosae]SCX36335.1 hypothetical protein DSM25559_5436 [Agrobacterium rosae]